MMADEKKQTMSSDMVAAVYDLRAINTPHGLHRLRGVEKLLLLRLADAWNLDFTAARENLDTLVFRTCLPHSRVSDTPRPPRKTLGFWCDDLSWLGGALTQVQLNAPEPFLVRGGF